jgi:hypothetical protein
MVGHYIPVSQKDTITVPSTADTLRTSDRIGTAEVEHRIVTIATYERLFSRHADQDKAIVAVPLFKLES